MLTQVSAFLRSYLGDGEWPPPGRNEQARPELPTRQVSLTVTGDSLVASIFDAIRSRRSVLITGPRGCGKTYCARAAIKRAVDAELVGGWHFLQGNREIPRDYLSEDLLVIDRKDKGPDVLDALVYRPPRGSRLASRVKAMRDEDFPEWPAIPTMAKGQAPEHTNDDWLVLFLDEINRFGDGFLDSLLSIVEAGVVVRRGEELFVPLVVIATANPPGYDATAKKLSPPLQARISRSYRVSQPPLDKLVDVIVPPQLEEITQSFELGVPIVSEETLYLASAATLCLWGEPNEENLGASYLTAGTRALLREAMREDRVLAHSMSELTRYISFGPDARAIGDWLGAAMGRAHSEWLQTQEPREAAGSDARIEVKREHLKQTALEVLGHKLRTSFNEGADPASTHEMEDHIDRVVHCVLTSEVLRGLFVLPTERVARHLAPQMDRAKRRKELVSHLQALEESRRTAWLLALDELPTEPSKQLDDWVRRASEVGALSHGTTKRQLTNKAKTRKPGFRSPFEQSWLRSLLTAFRGSDGADWIMNQVTLDIHEYFQEEVQQLSFASQFSQELESVLASSDGKVLAEGQNPAVQEGWLALVDGVIDPAAGRPVVRCRHHLERLLEHANANSDGVVRLVRASLEAIKTEGSQRTRERCAAVLEDLRANPLAPSAKAG